MFVNAPPRLRPAWQPACIAAAAAAAYATSFAGVFVVDDRGAIAENLSLRHWSTALLPPPNGLPVTGRPLVNLSLALNYALGGLNPAGYHALNLLIHVGAALALLGILRRTLGDGFGFAAALLWAVHPLTTAAVTYVSQRAESLIGLFLLLTLYAFIRGWRAGSVAACALGMACKEVMVVAPLLVWTYDVVFTGAGWLQALRRRRAYYAALAATWVILAVLLAGSGSRAGTAGFGSDLPWWQYAAAQGGVILHYVRLAFWPVGLVGDYGRKLPGAPAEWIAAWAVILAAVAATLWLLRRRSPFGFAGAWFFLILAPTSTVVPVATEIVAEQRMYLPLAAVIAVVVALAARLARTASVRAAAVAAAAVVLASLTASRNRVYHSVAAFWTDVAAKQPDNAGAWNNLGNLAADGRDWAAAEADYRDALKFAPRYADAHANLGAVLIRQGRFAEAIPHYDAALRFDPDDRRWLTAREYARSQAARPHVERGNAALQSGRPDEAMGEYRAALAEDPDLAEVHNNLGGILAENQQWAEAEAQFAAAVALDPGYAEARRNLQRVRDIRAKLSAGQP